MALSIPEFWKLVIESQLITSEKCKQLSAQFKKSAEDANPPTAKSLAQWLISQKAITRYQGAVLLSGRAGPFYYGDYKVSERLEKGKFVGDFRAVNHSTKHPVMLHFLTGPSVEQPNLWASVANSVQRQAAVVHPHLQRFYEVVDLGKFKFSVGENLRGKALNELLEEGKPLSANKASFLVWMAASALHQLHLGDRPHGDIRPANILLQKNGEIKLLCDPFRSLEPRTLNAQDTSETSGEMADYMAPEFSQPGKTPDVLTDIYALGCTLYQLLAGRPPFAGGDLAQKMSRHSSEAIAPLEELGVPKQLSETVAYMMAKNPAVRYQHASVVVEQLAHIATQMQKKVQKSIPKETLPAYEKWLAGSNASSPSAAQMPFVPTPAVATPVAQATPQIQTPQIQNPQIPVAQAPIVQSGIGPLPTAQVVFPSAQAPVAQAPLAASIDVAAPAATISIEGVGGPAVSSVSERLEEYKRKKKAVKILSAGVIVLLLGGGLTAYFMFPELFGGQAALPTGPDPGASKLPSEQITEKEKSPKTDTEKPPKQGPEIVEDDGKSLWVSPTSGEAISLQYVPPGTRFFMIVRPAELLADKEGQRVLAALGPSFETQRQQWEKMSGVPLSQVQTLVIGLHENEDKFPRASFVVRLTDAIPHDELVARWGNLKPTSAGAAEYFVAGDRAYYIPKEDPGNLFVMGPIDAVKEIIDGGDTPPPLNREIEQLRRVSDNERHVTLLFAKRFFSGDGREIFSGPRKKLKDPLDWFLGNTLKAGMVSFHLGENLYSEVRLLSSIDKDQYALSAELQKRVQETPGKIEDYFVSLSPPPYWKKVALRYPPMVRFLSDQSRFSTDGRQVIINSVAPRVAAHNLVFGSEMAIASQPGVAIAQAPVVKTTGPKSIEEVLQFKMSISFPQQSLEFAIRDIAAEIKDGLPNLPFPFEIKILGGDLGKEGITRNQQIRDFNHKDKPVWEVLTAIVMQANPVTTVKEPIEKDQKLIWVIGPDPDDESKKIILITTRAAAELKEYQLSPPFVAE